MTLLRAADIHLAWGSRTLFNGLNFVIEEGERVGLVGVNGSGKSTLMKILTGATRPDAGVLQLRRGARIVYLPQEPDLDAAATVESLLTVARAPLREAIEAHGALSARLQTAAGDEQTKLLAELAELSDHVERLGGWNTAHEARELLDRLGVKAWDQPVGELSGGLKKRVAIAQALLSRPDLLLLDEPTNHLDADTVEWLEDALDRLSGALLLVTHDRYFLDGLVDRIVEIEPNGTLTSYPGNYAAYLETKLVRLEEGERREHKRQRWIAQEVAWLRKGVEARRTKSRARIQRAQKLMSERAFQRPKVAEMQLANAPRLGSTVIEAEKVGKRFGEQRIFEQVDVLLRARERVGIVGPNGAGKTTLLRVLLGELAPDGGKVTLGKNTRVAYYDQHRTQLDPEKTVYEAAADDDWVMLGEQKIALRDYLDDLLFPVPMQRMQVKALSGGERNRLLLARLFLAGANVLVLDEPTNDLDIVTLNLLEQLLLGFAGTVLLVTHDRYFLDKVATAILAVEGDGKVTRFEGNFSMYRTLKAQAVPEARPVSDAPKSAPSAATKPVKRAGLSFKEKRELEGIEAAIEAAENRQADLEAKLNDPGTYANASADLPRLNAELSAATAAIEALYARWQELQNRTGIAEE